MARETDRPDIDLARLAERIFGEPMALPPASQPLPWETRTKGDDDDSENDTDAALAREELARAEQAYLESRYDGAEAVLSPRLFAHARDPEELLAFSGPYGCVVRIEHVMGPVGDWPGLPVAVLRERNQEPFMTSLEYLSVDPKTIALTRRLEAGRAN